MSFRGKLLENSKEISSVALLSPACLVCFVTHEVWGGILIGLVGWRPSPSGSSSVLYEKEKRSIVENKCVASTLYLN